MGHMANLSLIPFEAQKPKIEAISQMNNSDIVSYHKEVFPLSDMFLHHNAFYSLRNHNSTHVETTNLANCHFDEHYKTFEKLGYAYDPGFSGMIIGDLKSAKKYKCNSLLASKSDNEKYKNNNNNYKTNNSQSWKLK